MLQIRRYRADDCEAVRALHEAALAPTGAYLGRRPWDDDLDDIEGVYLEAGGEFLVGLLDGRLVAMGALRRTGADCAEVKRMRVHPECQRRGFGQTILDRLEARTREFGLSILRLDTTDRQGAARRFYEKNGYREVGRREVLDGGQRLFTLIVYEKRFAP